MKNTINCLDYCLQQAKMNRIENYEDSFILSAMDIVEGEQKIQELRESRWRYCSLGLAKNGDPKILIANAEGFKASLDAESKELSKIAQIKAFFVKVAPIFVDAQKELQGFYKLTLKGLEDYRLDCNNEIFRVNSGLRDRLGLMMQSIRGRGLTVNDVLQDPVWLETKEAGENRIGELQKSMQLVDLYLEKIRGILSGEGGDYHGDH